MAFSTGASRRFSDSTASAPLADVGGAEERVAARRRGRERMVALRDNAGAARGVWAPVGDGWAIGLGEYSLAVLRTEPTATGTSS